MSFCSPCYDEEKEIIFEKESHNDDLFFYEEDSEDNVILTNDIIEYCNTSITEIDDNAQ